MFLKLPIKFRRAISLLRTTTLFCISLFCISCNRESKNTQSASSCTTNRPATIYLTGAGASFPNPLYQNWFISIAREHPYLKINYQSIGSGAGIQLFSSGTIEFGATDVPLTPEEITRYKRKILQLPMTAGAVVLSYNIPGVTKLKLSRTALEGIFTGKILFWNDARVKEANPNLQLPDSRITVVHRADGSGTTHLFTSTLGLMRKKFFEEIGAGMTVEWPATGNFAGARGNEGVAEMIRQNQGSIGYLEYGYALQAKLPFALVENRDGYYIEPSLENGEATVKLVPPGEELTTRISDIPGQNAYPFITYTWLLVNQVYSNPAKAQAIEEMVEYGLTKGQGVAPKLGFIPLPRETREKIALLADTISETHHLAIE